MQVCRWNNGEIWRIEEEQRTGFRMKMFNSNELINLQAKLIAQLKADCSSLRNLLMSHFSSTKSVRKCLKKMFSCPTFIEQLSLNPILAEDLRQLQTNLDNLPQTPQQSQNILENSQAHTKSIQELKIDLDRIVNKIKEINPTYNFDSHNNYEKKNDLNIYQDTIQLLKKQKNQILLELQQIKTQNQRLIKFNKSVEDSNKVTLIQLQTIKLKLQKTNHSHQSSLNQIEQKMLKLNKQNQNLRQELKQYEERKKLKNQQQANRYDMQQNKSQQFQENLQKYDNSEQKSLILSQNEQIKYKKLQKNNSANELLENVTKQLRHVKSEEMFEETHEQKMKSNNQKSNKKQRSKKLNQTTKIEKQLETQIEHQKDDKQLLTAMIKQKDNLIKKLKKSINKLKKTSSTQFDQIVIELYEIETQTPSFWKKSLFADSCQEESSDRNQTKLNLEISLQEQVRNQEKNKKQNQKYIEQKQNKILKMKQFYLNEKKQTDNHISRLKKQITYLTDKLDEKKAKIQQFQFNERQHKEIKNKNDKINNSKDFVLSKSREEQFDAIVKKKDNFIKKLKKQLAKERKLETEASKENEIQPEEKQQIQLNDVQIQTGVIWQQQIIDSKVEQKLTILLSNKQFILKQAAKYSQVNNNFELINVDNNENVESNNNSVNLQKKNQQQDKLMQQQNDKKQNAKIKQMNKEYNEQIADSTKYSQETKFTIKLLNDKIYSLQKELIQLKTENKKLQQLFIETNRQLEEEKISSDKTLKMLNKKSLKKSFIIEQQIKQKPFLQFNHFDFDQNEQQNRKKQDEQHYKANKQKGSNIQFNTQINEQFNKNKTFIKQDNHQITLQQKEQECLSNQIPQIQDQQQRNKKYTHSKQLLRAQNGRNQLDKMSQSKSKQLNAQNIITKQNDNKRLQIEMDKYEIQLSQLYSLTQHLEQKIAIREEQNKELRRTIEQCTCKPKSDSEKSLISNQGFDERVQNLQKNYQTKNNSNRLVESKHFFTEGSQFLQESKFLSMKGEAINRKQPQVQLQEENITFKDVIVQAQIDHSNNSITLSLPLPFMATPAEFQKFYKQFSATEHLQQKTTKPLQLYQNKQQNFIVNTILDLKKYEETDTVLKPTTTNVVIGIQQQQLTKQDYKKQLNQIITLLQIQQTINVNAKDYSREKFSKIFKSVEQKMQNLKSFQNQRENWEKSVKSGYRCIFNLQEQILKEDESYDDSDGNQQNQIAPVKQEIQPLSTRAKGSRFMNQNIFLFQIVGIYEVMKKMFKRFQFKSVYEFQFQKDNWTKILDSFSQHMENKMRIIQEQNKNNRIAQLNLENIDFTDEVNNSKINQKNNDFSISKQKINFELADKQDTPLTQQKKIKQAAQNKYRYVNEGNSIETKQKTIDQLNYQNKQQNQKVSSNKLNPSFHINIKTQTHQEDNVQALSNVQNMSTQEKRRKSKSTIEVHEQKLQFEMNNLPLMFVECQGNEQQKIAHRMNDMLYLSRSLQQNQPLQLSVDRKLLKDKGSERSSRKGFDIIGRPLFIQRQIKQEASTINPLFTLDTVYKTSNNNTILIAKVASLDKHAQLNLVKQSLERIKVMHKAMVDGQSIHKADQILETVGIFNVEKHLRAL